MLANAAWSAPWRAVCATTFRSIRVSGSVLDPVMISGAALLADEAVAAHSRRS